MQTKKSLSLKNISNLWTKLSWNVSFTHFLDDSKWRQGRWKTHQMCHGKKEWTFYFMFLIKLNHAWYDQRKVGLNPLTRSCGVLVLKLWGFSQALLLPDNIFQNKRLNLFKKTCYLRANQNSATSFDKYYLKT